MASHPSQIIVRDGSTSSLSILIIGSGETAIFRAPLSQVIYLVTPSTAMRKASSVDIETKITTPIDTIRRKNSRRLQQHNAEKRNLKNLIQQLKLCLNGGAYTYNRYDHLYDSIMRTIDDQVDVSDDDYKVEHRHLI